MGSKAPANSVSDHRWCPPKPQVLLMKDIVSGPLDADKLDYLLRDSYY